MKAHTKTGKECIQPNILQDKNARVYEAVLEPSLHISSRAPRKNTVSEEEMQTLASHSNIQSRRAEMIDTVSRLIERIKAL